MTARPPIRPPRPSRSIPEAPAPSLTLVLPPSPGSDEGIFVTPLASPLVTSPDSEHPPEQQSLAQDSNTPSDSTVLTPIRAHYLKKELVQLQFQRELDALVTAPTNNVSTFSYLGRPFAPPPKDAPPLDLPFLRFFFRRFILSFPFLASAPNDFFPEKVQPFLANLLSRNLSPTSVLDDNPEHSEEAVRHRLLKKVQRNMSVLLVTATKLTEREEVVRLTQADLNRLELLARKRAARERRLKDSFDVNVVCVRTVTERKKLRSRVHQEFIIRTRRRDHPDVFVSRRYGDFRTLADELHKAHPEEEIPQPPAKDRSFVNVALSPTSAFSPSFPRSPPSSSSSSFPYSPPPSMGFAAPNVTPVASQMGRTPSTTSRHRALYDYDRNGSGDSFGTQSPGSPTSGAQYATMPSGGLAQQESRLAREKNRLTLRSYLHVLLSSSTLGSSPVLRSFLLSGPTRLTEEEMEDARRREEADRMRDDGRKRFASEITARVDGLRETVSAVKGELLGKDGLSHIFTTVKETTDVQDLPKNYRAVIEWARASLASTIFHHYVASDSASESFAALKRIHGLMPYFMLKAALKISNPVGMIRGVLDLFLAQPFGGRSLLQRMFSGSLMEEVKGLQEDIEAVMEKVDDPVMCEKVRLYVYAPREIQAVYKADAAAEKMHVLAVVLRSGEQPSLSRAQMQRVMSGHRAHKEYVKYQESLDDSDDDEGPQDEEGWLFEDLSLLATLYARLKDREQLIELIFEGSTAELLRDIITIFYAPLGQVYRAASIADSLGDMQTFINDLIRTVEQTEELSQTDPARTVQIFIDLVQRHEQAFYSFVHKVHSKGESLFSSLMHWIELFLTLVRDGLNGGQNERISLEFLLPHTGPEREAIMREVDAIAAHHYRLKVAYEAKIRRRFGRTQGMSDADAEDEAAAALIDGVVRDLSFGELVKGDADELAAADDAEDNLAESSSEEDSSSDSSGSGFGSESDDTDSETDSETQGGTETERDATPLRKAPPPTLARSRTTSHVPVPSSSRSPRPHHLHTQSQPRTPSHDAVRRSADLPSERRPPMPVRPQRSQTFSIPSRTSSQNRFKDLPPHPGSKALPPRPPMPFQQSSPLSPSQSRQQPSHIAREKSPAVPARPPPTPSKGKAKAKKDSAALKPPELTHIPKMLPLFVEMMRPYMLTRRETS